MCQLHTVKGIILHVHQIHNNTVRLWPFASVSPIKHAVLITRTLCSYIIRQGECKNVRGGLQPTSPTFCTYLAIVLPAMKKTLTEWKGTKAARTKVPSIVRKNSIVHSTGKVCIPVEWLESHVLCTYMYSVCQFRSLGPGFSGPLNIASHFSEDAK